MEDLRCQQREKCQEARKIARGLLQDRIRLSSMEHVMKDIQTEQEMRQCAQLLAKKSAITCQLLTRIKNGLLQSEANIKACMSVDAALPALLRLFSAAHVDSRLQLLAGHCLCNLALGDEQVCSRIAKAAGSYLVVKMDGLVPLLAESSVWTVGNLSSSKNAVEILKAQNAYHHVIKLYQTTADAAVKSACIYCLTHTIYNHSTIFSNDDYAEFAVIGKNLRELDSTSLFFYSLIAHNIGAMTAMATKQMHLDAVGRLAEMTEENCSDVSIMFSMVRILGNMVAEENGLVAKAVIASSCFETFVKKVMRADAKIAPELRNEIMWFLANILHHKSDEVKEFYHKIGLLNWLAHP